MYLIVTSKYFRLPNIQIRDSKSQIVTFQKKRRITLGVSFLKSDTSLMLGNTPREHIKFKSDAFTLLLKDLIRNPYFFLKRVFCTWEIEIPQEDKVSLPIDFEKSDVSELKVWVSRQAVLSGIYPKDLDVSLELDYLRSPMKFDIMVRKFESKNAQPYSIYSDRSYKFRENDNLSSRPNLSYESLENAKVISGRIVIQKDRIVPISNYRNESSIHAAGYLYQIENSQEYYPIKPISYEKGISRAIFVGYSASWFHFLVECVPRIMAIPENLRSHTPVILPESAPPQIGTVVEILTGVKFIPVGILEQISVDQLIIGKEEGVTDPLEFEFRRCQLSEAVNLMLSRRTEPSTVNSYPSRIFIKRPKGLFRPLQNERTVTKVLTRLNFKTISPESLSLQEVMCYMSNAHIIVAESGAAITNVLFASKGTTLIELYPGKGPMDFWPELAGIRGTVVRKVMSIRCPVGRRGIARDGIYIPIRKMRETIRKIEINAYKS